MCSVLLQVQCDGLSLESTFTNVSGNCLGILVILLSFNKINLVIVFLEAVLQHLLFYYLTISIVILSFLSNLVLQKLDDYDCSSSGNNPCLLNTFKAICSLA